jgi:hypothetical protein
VANDPINRTDPTGYNSDEYAMPLSIFPTLGRAAAPIALFIYGTFALTASLWLLAHYFQLPKTGTIPGLQEEWNPSENGSGSSGGGFNWGNAITAAVSILTLVSVLVNPNVYQDTVEQGTKPRQVPESFDIAFGVTIHLPAFTFAVGWDIKRLVLFWDEWGAYGLADPPPDESLPAEKGKTASIYVGTAAIWSTRFPEAQYPEAKIRFNLKEIEGGPDPGVTLWEYYLFKKQPMLWRRIVFYDFSSSGYDLENPTTYPKPLEGGALSSRRQQIESSKNYRTIQNLMGVP